MTAHRHPLLACLLLTLCLARPAHAQNLSNSWPLRAIAAGNQEAVELTINGRFIDRLPRPWFAQVVQITDRLSGELGIKPPALILFYDPAPNAFATYTTGGSAAVGINTEMMRLASGDAGIMAAVIGHELGHLKADHQRKSVQNRKNLGGLGAVVGAILDIGAATRGIDTGGAGQALASMGADLAVQKFSRDQEREADEIGVRAMTRQGYDPHAAGQLWDRMQLFGTAGAGSWLDSHPSSAERQATLDRLAQTLKPLPKKVAPVAVAAVHPVAAATVVTPATVATPAEAAAPAAVATAAPAPAATATPVTPVAAATPVTPAPVAMPSPATGALTIAGNTDKACAPGSVLDGQCIAQALPKNARVGANGEWECAPGYMQYAQRSCIPQLGR